MIIGIVDYNAGNLTSVVSAISHIGADYIVSSDHDAARDLEDYLRWYRCALSGHLL